jgi:hypothetical protein
VSANIGRNGLSENVKGRIKGIAKDVVNTEENNKLVSELKAKDSESLQGILEIISTKALSDFQKSDQINFRQDGVVNIEKETVERRALLEYTKRIIEEEVREFIKNK